MASDGQRTAMTQLWSPKDGRRWTVRLMGTGRILFEGTYEQAWARYEQAPVGGIINVMV